MGGFGAKNISEHFFFIQFILYKSKWTNIEQTTVKEGCWKADFDFTKAYCEKSCEPNEPEIALLRGTTVTPKGYILSWEIIQ